MQIEKRIKILNGKLLVVKASVEENKIKEVKLQGDFFFHPEEKIVLLEKAIVTSEISELDKDLRGIIDKNKLALCGITVEGICEAMQAIHEEVEAKK